MGDLRSLFHTAAIAGLLFIAYTDFTAGDRPHAAVTLLAVGLLFR